METYPVRCGHCGAIDEEDSVTLISERTQTLAPFLGREIRNPPAINLADSLF
jgi:hypothetical protein